MSSTAMARALVTQLAAHGVRDVVVAPGSRSAPLAYALADAEAAGWLRTHVRIDERTAGFFALGLARAWALRGEPRVVAVLTTSGTAVANLHPAVLEASHAGLPLLVVSADRPHMFAQEIVLYVDFWERLARRDDLTPQTRSYLNTYAENLEAGMDACQALAAEPPFPDENLASIPPCVAAQRARLRALRAELDARHGG